MTGGFKRRVAWAVALGACAGVFGCAKDPTSVNLMISADATVPPVRILRATITRSADPTQRVGSEQSSSNETDAADRPGPFVFPSWFPLTVDETFAGPVTIMIEGLDWDTHAVIASGTTATTVVARTAVSAELTLTASAGAGPADAGAL
jgi:hypothetical protein